MMPRPRPPRICLAIVAAFGIVGAGALSSTAARSNRWTELTPGGPFNRPIRRTLKREVRPNEVWSLEQVQGFIYVHVPVRALVVKLSKGLLCYGAVAPTEEMLSLLGDIERETGKNLTQIVLPTLATEHKLFAIAFAKRRPDAELWIAPNQFSFPLNVPNDLLGLGRARLLTDNARPPWQNEVSWTRVGPILSRDGVFEEVLCVHKKSRTLLCCDLLASVPEKVPDVIVANDPRALIFHGRDRAQDPFTDFDDAWKKIALFSLYFQSSALSVVSEPDGTLTGAINFIRNAFPQSSLKLGWFNFFAWSWPDKQKTEESFQKLRCEGALLVPPVLSVAILNRGARDLKTTLTEELDHGFDYVAPCHFDAAVRANINDVYDAVNAAIYEPLGLSPLVKPILENNHNEKKTVAATPAPPTPPEEKKKRRLVGRIIDRVRKRRRQNNTDEEEEEEEEEIVVVVPKKKKKKRRRRRAPLPDEDLAFLRKFENTLLEAGAIDPVDLTY